MKNLKRFLVRFIALLLAVLCLPFNSVANAANNKSEYHVNKTRKVDTKQPCYGEYELLPDESVAISKRSATKGAVPKDDYESNNSFIAATRLNWKPSSKPSDFSVSREATLHRESWLWGLIQNEVDEDYWRVDVYGNATLKISLTNIPAGCDYDIKLYKHDNIRYCKEDSISLLRTSMSAGNTSESITRTVSPGTYYIWVYSFDDSYDANNKYKLSVSVTYTSGKKDSIANLRFNKGAKAALWVSDYDPCGMKAFKNSGRIEVGYHIPESTLSQSFENPFLNSFSRETVVEQGVLFIWDKDLRNGMRSALNTVYNSINSSVSTDQTLKMVFSTATSIVDTASTICGVVSLYGGAPNLPESFKKLFDTAVTLSPIVASMLESIFTPSNETVTTKKELLNYLRDLITALEANAKTGEEVVRITYGYKISSKFVFGANTTLFYIDCTQSPQSSYLFSSDTINAWSSNSIVNGTIYGIKKPSDVKNAINHGSNDLKDVNTSRVRTITLNNSIPGTIRYGEYHWFKFTASTAGTYSFYTENSFDTYGELFSKVVPGRSTSNRLAYNDDGNGNRNFKVEYRLSAGQTIYLRVRGYNWTKTGNYSVRVSKK